MPLYHLHVSSGSRGDRASAAAAASYLLRLGRYARGREAPAACGWGNLPAWANDDPLVLFAAADRYERANGRLYVAIEAALPVELGEDEHVELVRGMMAEVAESGLPFLWVIHPGRPAAPGRPQNWHFHGMFSERITDGIVRDPASWFRRANPRDPAKGGAAKTRGLKGHQWVDGVRHAWERRLNERLDRVGAELVTCESHRTRIARAEAGGDAETADDLRRHPPSRHLGPAASAIERGRAGRPGQPTARGALARASAGEAARLREQLESTEKLRRRLQDEELRDARAAADDAGVNVNAVVDGAPAGYKQQLAALDAATRTGRERIRTDARAVGLNDVEIERIRGEAVPDTPDLGWAAVVAATAVRRERQATTTPVPLCASNERQDVPAPVGGRQDTGGPAPREPLVVFSGRQDTGGPAPREPLVVFSGRQDTGGPAPREPLVVFSGWQDTEGARPPVRFSGRQDVSRSRTMVMGAEELEAARSAFLSDDAIELLHHLGESRRPGSGPTVVRRTIEMRLEQKHLGEVEAKEVDLDAGAVYQDAQAQGIDPVAALTDATKKQTTAIRARAHRLGIDDHAIGRIRYVAESTRRGSGWGAVRDEIAQRIMRRLRPFAKIGTQRRAYERQAEASNEVASAQRRELAEADARAVGLDVGCVDEHARAHDKPESAARRQLEARIQGVRDASGGEEFEQQLNDEFAQQENEVGRDPDGEELLRRARVDILGVEREPETLAERSAVLLRAQASRDSAVARRSAAADRVARLDRCLALPDGDLRFFEALDRVRPDWRTAGTRPADVDLALDRAEGDLDRSSKSTPEQDLVFRADGEFPGTSSATLYQTRSAFDESSAVGRKGKELSGRLADRARAREIVAERSPEPASSGLMRRLVVWLRTQIARLLGIPLPGGAQSPSLPAGGSKATSVADSPPSVGEQRAPGTPDAAPVPTSSRSGAGRPSPRLGGDHQTGGAHGAEHGDDAAQRRAASREPPSGLRSAPSVKETTAGEGEGREQTERSQREPGGQEKEGADGEEPRRLRVSDENRKAIDQAERAAQGIGGERRSGGDPDVPAPPERPVPSPSSSGNRGDDRARTR